MANCKTCLHAAVCGKRIATGGQVKGCKNFLEKKTGRWRKTYTCHGEQLWGYECNQCKADNPIASYYCPHCGADMRGEDDA